MQLFVTLTDLASPQKPLYVTSENRTSKDKPGAAISMNPYVAAAKFRHGKECIGKDNQKHRRHNFKDVISHLAQ